MGDWGVAGKLVEKKMDAGFPRACTDLAWDPFMPKILSCRVCECVCPKCEKNYYIFVTLRGNNMI